MPAKTLRFAFAHALMAVLAFVLGMHSCVQYHPMGSAAELYNTFDQRPRLWRTMHMADTHNRRPPGDEIRVPVSRFKTLRSDPILLQLEAILREINKWDTPEVQHQLRVVRFGTPAGRDRALAHLVAMIDEYKATVVASQDVYMPYATADQIGNNGTGIHILDQAGNNAPLRASKSAYCLLWLVVGPQGGGKSSALYHQLRQMDVPFTILCPKGTWQFRARELQATVIPPDYLRFDFHFDEELLPLYLHSVAEGMAFCSGLQYGLSCLYEALDIAMAQLHRYTEATGEQTCLCLKDVQQTLHLCDTRNPKRAQYFEAARTALDLLVGRNNLFSTRSGLPLTALFEGRYILPCWHLSTVQCRFLAWFLLNNLQFRSLRLPETTELKSLFVVDDSSRFISRPDSVFGSGSRTSVYLHLLSTLRSTGRGCVFVGQNVEAISDDVKGLCNNWLLCGGIRGAGNQAQIAAAIGLSRDQATALGRLQSREAICFCPTTYPRAVHGFIPEVPPPTGRTG